MRALTGSTGLLLFLATMLQGACGGGGSSGGGGTPPPAPDPVSAAQSTLAVSPGSVTADGAASVTVTATARNAGGAPLAGRTAVFTAGGSNNTLSATSATTAADGRASITLRSTRAEAKSLSVVIDGVPVTQTASASFAAGPPSSAATTLVASPATVPDDGTPAALTATVRDAFGNPVAGATVTFASGGGATLVQPAVPTGANGVATGSATAAVPGMQTITASVASTALATADVTFVPGPPDGAHCSLVPAPATAPADGTTAISLLATVQDQHGHPIAGATVVLTTSGTGTLTQPSSGTAANGTASGGIRGAVAGSETVSAKVGTATVASTPVTFTPVPVSPTLSTVAVAPASVPADGATAATVTVTLRDAASHPLAGRAVALAYSGSATGTGSATTGALGTATWSLTAAAASTGTLTATAEPGAGQVVLAAAPALSFFEVHRIGGTVTGLTGSGLVLSTTGQPDLPVTGGATTFTFPAWVTPGTAYAVTVKAQPSHQTCFVAGGTGTVGNAEVTTVAVDCQDGKDVFSAGSRAGAFVKADGTLWVWGENSSASPIGDGTLAAATSPVQIGTGFAAVHLGQGFGHAIKIDGTLWGWGLNSFGWVGNPAQQVFRAPVQVGTATTWRRVSHGSAVVALQLDGSLWAWGLGTSGEVGDGAQATRFAPVQIGTGYVRVAGCVNASMASKTDGTLWGWGIVGSAILGTSSTPYLVPTQFASGYVDFQCGGGSHVVALDGAGALWTWGSNDSGQAGNGSTGSTVTVPFQVGTGYASVGAGPFTSYGVKTNGTAWGWGGGGLVGDGGTAVQSAPVQIGTGFTNVNASANLALGVKSDGTLWSWGHGWTGDGSSSQRLLPAQIASGLPAP